MSDGDVERVMLVVSTYGYGDNLYVGLESFVPEIGSFDTYGDVTVNLDALPTLYAAVDTNNGGQKIVDFLERNGIARDTGLTKMSGWCTYPVVVFNPTPLFRADPEAMEEHLAIRDVDPETIAEMRKAAFKDIEKKAVEPDRESLSDLTKEAKQRAEEKNATRPEKPADKAPDYDL